MVISLKGEPEADEEEADMLLLRPDVFSVFVSHVKCIDRGEVPRNNEVFDRELNVIDHYRRVVCNRNKKRKQEILQQCLQSPKPKDEATIPVNNRFRFNVGFCNSPWEEEVPGSMVTNTNTTNANLSPLQNSIETKASSSPSHLDASLKSTVSTQYSPTKQSSIGRSSPNFTTSGLCSRQNQQQHPDLETEKERDILGRDGEEIIPCWIKDIVAREMKGTPSLLHVNCLSVKDLYEKEETRCEKFQLLLRLAKELLELWEALLLLEKNTKKDYKVQACRTTRLILSRSEDTEISQWNNNTDMDNILHQLRGRFRSLKILPAVSRLLIRGLNFVLKEDDATQNSNECDNVSKENNRMGKNVEFTPTLAQSNNDGFAEVPSTWKVFDSYINQKIKWASLREVCLLFGFCPDRVFYLLENHKIDGILSLYKLYRNSDLPMELNVFQVYGLECWELNIKERHGNILNGEDANKLWLSDHIYASGWASITELEENLSTFNELLYKLKSFKFGQVKLCETHDHSHRNALKVLVHVIVSEKNKNVLDNFVNDLNQLEDIRKQCSILITHENGNAQDGQRLYISRVLTIAQIKKRSVIIDMTLSFSIEGSMGSFTTLCGYYSPPAKQLKNALFHLKGDLSSQQHSPGCGAVAYYNLVRDR